MSAASASQLLEIGLVFAAISTWILLPIIPAVLIHRALPDNKMEIDGPLQGLRVKAGGAIGSYILLLLIVGVAMQSQVFPPISRLDDGGWQFNIPFLVQDKNAATVFFENGSWLSVDADNHPNPESRQAGMMGYEATLRATRIDGKLPTVKLIAHLPGGMTAASDPIDLEAYASGSTSADRQIDLPLRALRSTQSIGH